MHPVYKRQGRGGGANGGGGGEERGGGRGAAHEYAGQKRVDSMTVPEPEADRRQQFKPF